MKAVDLNIDENGLVEAIYDDDLAELVRQGVVGGTCRASHVEPEGNEWSADMSPVGGPKLTGFTTRAEALAAEVRWLKANRNL